MSTKGIVAAAFPAKRRPVTVRSVLPLAVFVPVFLASCLAAQFLGVMTFGAPAAFLLAAAMPWVWWQHHNGFSGLRGTRSVVALVTRLALVAALVMLLAEPRAVRKSDVLAVVYALDVSDSIGEGAGDAALSYVARTVSAKPERDEAGLVVFGRDAAAELPPRVSFPFEAVNSRITKDGTDLSKGLSLAAAMLPDDRAGRIVLISDGAQTEGNLPRVLDELTARRIPVDVLGVEYDYTDEVWLEKLELPRFVRAGETYEASVVLSSLRAGSGRLVVRENGRAIFEDEVEYRAGKNRYSLPLYLRGPGYYEYVAALSVPPGKDGWQENNRAVNHLYLRGEGQVLVVTDPAGDSRDWTALIDALRGARFVVRQAPTYELPHDAVSLMPYDCVVLVNCPADEMDVVQMQALHDAVYDMGIGLLMVGGENAFGPGGYHRTPVEDALPVTMDITQKKVIPKGALVIILHTCEFDEGNTWGKRVAKRAIRVLGAQDEVGVLVYGWDGGEQWLFDLTPAGEYERLAKLINEAQIGDMPSFVPTMQMGLNSLRASDAAVKHMIIISDGDPSPPPPALLQSFVDAKVTVSTVAINPHGPQDANLMQSIAQATGGRFYYPRDPSLLPAIFVKEAKTLKRSMIQNVTFTPEVSFPSPILKGIDALPELLGYVVTTPKGRSRTILKAPIADQVDPVLSVWRYGLGQSAAFTSDLSPNWAASWVDWQGYRAFVQQLVGDVARTEQESHLTLRAAASGSTGLIAVEDSHPRDSFLAVQATVKGPQGRTETVRLKQTGPRRYDGEFPLWGEGRYQIVAVGVGDGRSERRIGSIIVPYSPEYLRFRSDPSVLREIAEKTGGRLLKGNEDGPDIFVKEREARAASRPIGDLFLLIIVCLIPFDVAVRRIQVDWWVICETLGFGKGRAESMETMGALLARKKSIRFAPPDEGAGEVARRAAATAAKRPSEAAAEPRRRPTPPEETAGPDEEAGLSTAARLLKRKRKRREDKE